MRFLLAVSDLEYTWIVLDRQSHGLSPNFPPISKIFDTIVLLNVVSESRAISETALFQAGFTATAYSL